MRRNLFTRLFIISAALAVLPVMSFTILYVFLQEKGTDIFQIKVLFMGFILALIVCSVVISYIIASKTERPLKELLIATEQFSRGKFDYRVPDNDTEDFQMVNEAFNEMATAISLLTDELRGAKNYFKQLYDSIANHVVIISPNRTVIEVNEKFLRDTGLAHEEAAGRKCWELIHSYERPCEEMGCACHLGEVYRDGIQRSAIHTSVKNGKKVVQNIVYTPIRDQDGAINFVLEDIRDVSAIAEMQERFKDSEKMAAVGRLISGLSHEINNPLAIISGYVQYADETGLSRDGKVKVVLDKIKDASERIGKLMRILMDFAGVDNVPLHPVSVNDALRNTFSLLQNEIAEGSISIVAELDESSPSAMAREDIIRAFYNIAVNAIEAMSGQKERVMTVKSEADDNLVKITFSDTGAGVPAESISRLIEPFFTTKEFGRLGMGLSTAYSLIRNYGGDIKFINNDGLSVIITLRRA